MHAHAHLLRDHPLFRRLPARVLNQLTARSERVEFPKGTIIAREGDPGDALFVVLSGRCEATLRAGSGRPRLIEIYGPGSTFGERPLLSGDQFSATIRVLTDCVALRIPAADVRAVAVHRPEWEQDLLHRLYGEFRVLRAGASLDKLGRIAVLCSLSRRVAGADVARALAAALRQETGRSVLLVAIVCEPGGLTFADWQRLPPCSLEELRTAVEARKAQTGVWELRLHVRAGAQDAAYVAPVLSHLTRYARYLVIHIDAAVPEAVALQLLIQSDLPYLLFGQRDEDVARAQALCRRLAEHPSRESVQPLPLVCLEPGERALPQAMLDERLGVPVHGTLPAASPAAPDVAPDGLPTAADRFRVHLRLLAREIGRCRVGLALSSGGAKSIAHIGVIQVLEEQGIEVDVVAGTSMGALIAALWAYGHDGQALEMIARRNENPWALWSLIDPVLPARRGFIAGRAAWRITRAAVGDAHFADLLRQLRVVATDLDTLERVVFDRGEVAPIVHASMAMPGIVVPVELDGRTLVDGGVAEPLPVNVLAEMGVERIIAVNTIPNPEDMKRCAIDFQNHRPARRLRGRSRALINRYVNYFAHGNILDVWAKSMHGAETRVAEEACKRAEVVIRPVSCEGRWHDFGHPRKYIALGRQVALEQLDALRRLKR